MNRLIFISLLLLGLATSVIAQGWKPVNSGTTSYLIAATMPKDSTGYIVGYSGTILKTLDGGNTWSKQVSGTHNALHSVCFIDENTGYAAGEYGTILKTTNGGAVWHDISPGISEALLSIHFPDPLTGFASGGAFISTSDGGSNWPFYQEHHNNWFRCVYFLNADKGFASTYSGIVLSTLNGGQTWAYNIIIAKMINSFYFLDNSTGYAVGENIYNQALIMKTHDGGINWNSQNFVFSPALSSVHFPNSDTGYAVGGNGMIFKTVNGGQSWTDFWYKTPQWLNAVAFTDGNHGIIAATGGLILKTETGGEIGIEERSGATIRLKLFPNPAGDILHLEPSGPPAKCMITLSDVNGIERIREFSPDGKATLDISHLPSGVYLVSMTRGDTKVWGRFVKE